MREKYDLVVFADICCDLIFSGIERLPEPGEEIWADQMKIMAGGAFNVAAAASRLNLKTGIPCIYGTDIMSSFIHAAAMEEGIDTSLFLHTRQPYLQASVVLNLGNDRSFVSYAAKEKEHELGQHVENIVDEVPMEAAVFGMTDKEDYLELMKKLRRRGTKVILDCGWDERLLTSEILQKQIENCDYFLPNLMEARKITGELEPGAVIRKLSEHTANTVVKLGGDGVIAACGGRFERYPSVDLGKVVDTTGAGDNFTAGFAYGLVHKKSQEECILYGQLCGSKSTVALGGFTASLYESELMDLVHKMDL